MANEVNANEAIGFFLDEIGELAKEAAKQTAILKFQLTVAQKNNEVVEEVQDGSNTV